MSLEPSARLIATEVLIKVDIMNAYANIELDKRLRILSIDPRDKALATELVYGTLRWQGQLDAVINQASSRPIAQIAAPVRNVLRVTAYQLLHLNQVPQHAAVNEAVNLVRQLKQSGAAGFANAVSRRIAREGTKLLAGTPDESLAIAWSHPAWLVERWLNIYGESATTKMLQTNQKPAELVLRINTLKISRVAFLAALSKANIYAHPGDAPDAVVIEGGVAAGNLPGYDLGWYVVQDQSSQLVAHAVNPQPGEFVADLCSAPGGKTTHLAQLMQDQGEVAAVELHPHRAKLISRTATRLGLESIHVYNRDSRNLPLDWHGKFHRVLLDAPCMGTGVLRRRVDLRWRIGASDLNSLVVLQKELLDAAAAVLRPQGTIVYSTCSLEPEENTNQVTSFLALHPEFKRGDLSRLAQIAPGMFSSSEADLSSGELQLLPRHQSDGFFIAILQHR